MKNTMPDIPALLGKLSSGNDDAREQSAKELIALGMESIPHLTALLAQADKKLREYLVWMLVEIGPPSVPAAEQMLSAPSSLLRIAATDILGNVPMSRSTGHLIKALRDECAEVRDGAVWALSRNAESSLPLLIKSLSDKSSVVRESAAKIIASIGENAVSQLVRALKGADTTARVAIMEILAAQQEKAEKHLIRLLSGKDDELRCLAARALGAIQSVQAVPALVEAALNGGKETLDACLSTLISTGQDAFEYLFCVLQDEDFRKRDIASRVFAKCGTSASAFLSERITSKDADTRKRIARVLGWIKDARSFDILLQCLKDEDPAVRDTSAWALGELGDSRCIDALVDSMSDVSMGINFTQAVYSLSLFKNVNFVDRIPPLLKHSSVAIRWKAALLFGLMKNRDFTGKLVECLNDEDVVVRRRIITSLGDIGDPSALPPLKEMLLKGPTDSWSVVRAAISRLDTSC